MDTVINCSVEQSKEIQQDNLVGIHLHGSAFDYTAEKAMKVLGVPEEDYSKYMSQL